MPRRAKNYRVELAPRLIAAESGGLGVRFTDEHGEVGRVFDFEQFGRMPMAGQVALAFRHYGADKPPGSRATTFGGAISWFAFMDSTRSSVMTTREVDGELVRAYIAWLDRSTNAKASRHGTYGQVKRLLSWLQRNRPDLVHPRLEFPYNPYPRPQSDCVQRKPLQRSEIEAVLAAARKEIEENWRLFQMGRAALGRVDRAAIVAAPDVMKLDLHDLGVMLAVIVERFGGIVPTSTVLKTSGAGLGPLYKAMRRHGGVLGVMPLLYATSEVLTPYLLVLGASLYANPSSLTTMRRDCMLEHVLLDGRSVVTWSKERAGRVQRRSFLRGNAFSVPNMIEQILELTQTLVEHAAPKHRDKLFLCATKHRGERTIGPYPRESSTNLESFVARNELCDESGASLRLVLSMLRTTGLSLAHEALGGDVLKTQLLANHADPVTTVRYIDKPAERARHQLQMGRLQRQFVNSVQRGVLTHVGRHRELPTVDARNVTASGFTCADPLAGAGPGQKPGQLCTAWLGCFTCPNAVIPMTVDVLARLLETKEALLKSRDTIPSERWQVIYAPKLGILDRDILPRFPPKVVAAALLARSGVPRTPPVE